MSGADFKAVKAGTGWVCPVCADDHADTEAAIKCASSHEETRVEVLEFLLACARLVGATANLPSGMYLANDDERARLEKALVLSQHCREVAATLSDYS